MALIRCPECRKKVSDTAPACPQCGYVSPNVPAETDNSAELPTVRVKIRLNKGPVIVAALLLLAVIGLVILATMDTAPVTLDVTDDALDLAKKTLIATDRCLDGLSTVKAARSTVDSYYNDFDKIEDYGDNYSLRGYVFLVSSDLYLYTVEESKGTKESIQEQKDKVLEARNRLAYAIGEKRRKE